MLEEIIIGRKIVQFTKYLGAINAIDAAMGGGGGGSIVFESQTHTQKAVPKIRRPARGRNYKTHSSNRLPFILFSLEVSL